MNAISEARISDSQRISAHRRGLYVERFGIVGIGKAELFGPDGKLKQRVDFHNLVTRVGNQFWGDRASLIRAGTQAVTAITNATTAVCTTTGAPICQVGDVVTLAGITPTAYNGSWAVTAVTTTTFSIYVGTALGALSVAGTAVFNTLPNVSHMKLGTGNTAPSGTGAGAAIVTYGAGVTASKALDATFPLSSLVATDTRQIQYKTTWNAGEATVTGLNEVVLSLEPTVVDDAGTAANTMARALLSPVVNKGALDTLAVTWNIQLLGT